MTTGITVIPASNISNMMTHESFYVNDFRGTVEQSYENILPSQTSYPMNTSG